MHQENIILDRLGLARKLLENPILTTHYSTHTRIEEEIRQNSKSLSDSDSWEEAFYKLGFTKEKSKILHESIRQGPTSMHLTPVMFTIKHLSLQFKYSFQPSLEIKKHYKEELKSCQEFCPKIKTTFMSHEQWQKHSNNGLFKDYFNQPETPLNKVNYWFHGTDLKSAFNIMLMGILPSFGNKRLHYSNGNSFYMTSNFQFAYDWPQLIPKPSEAYASALMIFEDKNQTLKNEGNGLILEADSDLTERTMKYFKRDEDRTSLNFTIKETRQLCSYDYIFGPIPTKDHATNNSVNKVHQLCLKTREIADSFYNDSNNIKEVIILGAEEMN